MIMQPDAFEQKNDGTGLAHEAGSLVKANVNTIVDQLLSRQLDNEESKDAISQTHAFYTPKHVYNCEDCFHKHW